MIGARSAPPGDRPQDLDPEGGVLAHQLHLRGAQRPGLGQERGPSRSLPTSCSSAAKWIGAPLLFRQPEAPRHHVGERRHRSRVALEVDVV